MTTPITFTGKSVLITGAASGIGYALAAELVNRGALVWMTDINPDVTDRANAIGAKGQVLDVRSFIDIKTLVEEIVNQHERLDFLFNNAGIGYGCDAAELTPEHYDQYIDINIRGVTNGINVAYTQMLKQGYGTIVNTASVGGLIPSPIMAPYAMTKHAVVGLSESLRLEARLKGINIITLCPGSVDTPMFDAKAPTALGNVTSSNLRRFTQQERISISTQVFAQRALNDIARNKTLIVHPFLFKVLYWLYRHFPALYLWLSAPNLKQEMQRLSEKSD